jgi:hypothetical protein
LLLASASAGDSSPAGRSGQQGQRRDFTNAHGHCIVVKYLATGKEERKVRIQIVATVTIIVAIAVVVVVAGDGAMQKT